MLAGCSSRAESQAIFHSNDIVIAPCRNAKKYYRKRKTAEPAPKEKKKEKTTGNEDKEDKKPKAKAVKKTPSKGKCK